MARIFASQPAVFESPVILLVVVFSLALRIGASSTVFSVIDTLLYRPLPYPHPEQLVVIWETRTNPATLSF